MSRSRFFPEKRARVLFVLFLLLTLLLPRAVTADEFDFRILKYTVKGLTGTAQQEERAKWVNMAKNYALQYNRPLLVEASLVYCPNCDKFESSILDNATFKKFVKDYKIVVLSLRDDALQTKTKNYYKTGGDTPNIYLFNIAQNTVADTTAFNKDEVAQPPLYASENDPSWTVNSFITLIKSKLPIRDLSSIAISGNDSIPTGGTATYSCTAKWTDGSSGSVTPTWSLDSTAYATVANGVVTNKNTTTAEKTVTLKASYTDDGITKTAQKTIKLAPKTLKAIKISGKEKLSPEEEASYTCTATWSYGDATEVTSECTWSLRSQDAPYATVSSKGVVKNTNSGDNTQTVRLTASYTCNGITKTNSMDIALEPDKYHFVPISYSGSENRNESIEQVLKQAKKKNRPLLLLVSAENSGNFATFKEKVVTSDFNDYVQANSIVTLIAEDSALQKKLLEYYPGSKTRGDTGAMPQVYLFKVLKNDTSGIEAFNPTRVEPLKSADGNYEFAEIYDKDGCLMGISNVTDAGEWAFEIFKKQIEVALDSLPKIKKIEVVGANRIATGCQAVYFCKVTWEDNDSVTTVSPEWSLDSDYATFADNNDGVVVNNNKSTTTEEQVTLTASYNGFTVDKTITLEPLSLFALAISGGASVVPKDGATFTCIATWSDWSTSDVTEAAQVTWGLSSTTYASVSAAGVVTNKNTTNANQTATLTATYSGKTASLGITLAPTTAGGGEFDFRILKYTVKGLTGAAQQEERGKWVNMAKNYALQYNRPLLLEASLVYCPNCDNFESKILDNATFKQFVKDYQIVVLSVRDDALQTKTKNYYKTGGDTPNIYLFNIAQNTVADTTAFNKDEVAQPPLYASENDPSWTVSSFIALIKSKLTSQKSLESISISGADSIPTGGDATYTCTAKWSDKTTSEVTPEWTLSNYTYASIANGAVKNNNFTNTAKTVTLTAKYDSKTATKTITLAPLTLTSLALEGPGTIASGEAGSYVCKATWSNGSSNVVIPDSWSLSSTTYASVSAGIVTNKNSTDSEKTVTLTASYAGKTAKMENIVLAPKSLVSIQISGDRIIPNEEGNNTRAYTCTAIWSYGDSAPVTPTWNLVGANAAYATVSANGVVTNNNDTLEDKSVTLKAVYSGKEDTLEITLAKVPKYIVGILIDGNNAIAWNTTESYTCKAVWSDESETALEAALTWSLSPEDAEVASLNAAQGKVTNVSNYTVEMSITLQASCTINGNEFSATLDVTMAAIPANTCLLTLEAGKGTCFGLSFTPDAKSLAALKAAGTIWIWDGEAYVEMENISAGMAGFIMPNTRSENTTLTLTGTAADPAALKTGWNLVSPHNLPQNAPAFMLDNTTNSYIRYKDTNKADAACWVFVK